MIAYPATSLTYFLSDSLISCHSPAQFFFSFHNFHFWKNSLFSLGFNHSTSTAYLTSFNYIFSKIQPFLIHPISNQAKIHPIEFIQLFPPRQNKSEHIMSEADLAKSNTANADNNTNIAVSSISAAGTEELRGIDEEGKRRNDDNESKINGFKEITGVTDDDLARRFLSNHDFDVESAVLTYFASSSSSFHQDNDTNIQQQQEEIFNRYQPPAAAVAASTPNTNSASINPVGRTPSPTPSTINQNNLFQDQTTSSSSSSVYNNNINNRGGIIDSISSAVLWPFRLLSGAQIQTGDDTSDARKFVESFEKKYYHESREEAHINFLPISYRNALLQAARERKSLFVYLHCNEHPNTDAFCREVLTSADVCNTVNNSMIAWGGDIDYKDAYQALFSFQVTEFPFIAILMVNGVGQSQQQQRFASARIIDKVEGYESSHMFLTRIRQAMQQTAHAAAAQARAQREAAERARLLEEQQDELRQAMEEDKRREEEEKRREEELKQQELEEERRLKLEEEAREKEKKELIENIENKRRNLLKEPDESDKNAFTIRFQLPEGTKLSVSYVTFTFVNR